MKAGVVGCGYWGPNLVRTLIESNRCAEVHCFDPSAEAVRKISRRYPSVKVSHSFDEIIGTCDALMIATPVATHYSMARYALLAGKPIFVEKPLTNSLVDGQELVSLAKKKSLTLMVGHTFVYSPPVRKIREYVASNILGEIFFLSSSRVNLGQHRSDVNVVWDLAPHDVSMLIYWLGQAPKRVSAVGRACVGSMIDVASLHFEFESGTLANVEVSWLSPIKLRRTVIVGSRKMVLYDDTLPSEKIKLYDRGVTIDAPTSFGEFQLAYRNGDLVSPFLETTEPLMAQTNQFLDCVQYGRKPESDGQLGLQVVMALEAACLSIERDGMMVDIDSMNCVPFSGTRGSMTNLLQLRRRGDMERIPAVDSDQREVAV